MQNHVLVPEENATDVLRTWTKGAIGLEHVGIWESRGVEYERVFQALRDIEYDGYVTVHQAFAGVMSPCEASRRSIEYLRDRTA